MAVAVAGGGDHGVPAFRVEEYSRWFRAQTGQSLKDHHRVAKVSAGGGVLAVGVARPVDRRVMEDGGNEAIAVVGKETDIPKREAKVEEH